MNHHGLYLAKSKPLRTKADTDYWELHFLKFGIVYAVLFLVGIFGYNYLYGEVQPGLQMTKELKV
jgi:hypothetical protein